MDASLDSQRSRVGRGRSPSVRLLRWPFRIVVALELVGREVMTLVDTRVVLDAEFVLYAIHLVLVSPEVPASLDPAVLTAHDGDKTSDDRHLADVRTEARPERIGATSRCRTHADFMEQPVPHI